MRIWIQCALALLLTSLPAIAGDVAILRNGFSIRHERRTVIGLTTRLYLGSDNTSYVDVPTADIDHFEQDLTPVSAPAQEAAPPVAANTASNSIPVKPPISIADAVSGSSQRYHLDPDLVNSVIRAESAFNPRAVSNKGAQGLMQLMPKTAGNLGVKNAFDPETNVDAGTRYLRELLERYNFDLIKALAAYNAGPHRVEQYGGVPPYRETHAYVSRIIRDFNKKKIAQEKQTAAPPAAKHTSTPKRQTAP
jgi:soluble lytic murein transglycosylase-like protein